jgi:DNA-binding NarL/FixJ family response regulator/predicted regulator of Ras-like GTPase activity (Roadblock/LC7/MglB family)
MVKHTVLVADGDPAFSTILREALEATGDYVVTPVPTASAALKAVLERPFDMVIVDSALADVQLATMIETMRAAWPAIRIMLIPHANNRIPPDLQTVEVQGLLPKPFFVGDLPALVRHAMELDDAIPLGRLAEMAEEAPVTLHDTEAEVFFSMMGPAAAVELPELVPLDEPPEVTATATPAESMPAAELEAVAPQPGEPAQDTPISDTPEAPAVPERHAEGDGPASESSLPPPPSPASPLSAAISPPPRPEPAPKAKSPAVTSQDLTREAPKLAGTRSPDRHGVDLAPIIRALERELPTRAVVVTRGDRVIASSGAVGAGQQAKLAQLIAERMATSSRLMGFFAKPDEVVELVLEEGRDTRIYTVRVTAEVLLTVATSPTVPLGTLRYRARQVAEEIVAALR